MSEADPLAAMLLESAEAEEVERIARQSLEERVASVERKLDAVLELLRAEKPTKGNGLKAEKKRISITVTGRDDADRIETLEVS